MNDVEGIKIAPKIETEKLNPEKAGAIFYLMIYAAITANRSTQKLRELKIIFKIITYTISYKVTNRMDLKGAKSEQANV